MDYARGPAMQTLEHHIPNDDGWELSLFQTHEPRAFDPALPPVMIVPGYGMNSFIFSYHPSGPSLEGYLARRGFEVWRVDLRAQGGSRPFGVGRKGLGLDDFRLYDLAMTDLDVAIEAALDRTRSRVAKVSVIGASLGGTILFTHVVLKRDHRVGRMVSIGSPLRWVRVHPVLRAAFVSPTLVGLVRLRGTRKLAEKLLPELVRRAPWALSVYMNPAITDVSAAREMVRTVEDPNRFINREIAAWMRDRDLVVGGVNVAEGLRRLNVPLMVVVAKQDGIVPRETAAFPYEAIGSSEKRLVEVGSREAAMAHADMFVSKHAEESVFVPVAEWLGAAPETPGITGTSG
jgi:pimeloyl-ACP methyl ester carboxylesterase